MQHKVVHERKEDHSTHCISAATGYIPEGLGGYEARERPVTKINKTNYNLANLRQQRLNFSAKIRNFY
jgi:hypothetical protein